MKLYWKFSFLVVMNISLHAAGQVAERYDVVISEIMADPSPVVGLPNAEYVEITNRSLKTISLQGWKLSDASSVATISANYIIEPGSILILCANSQVNNFLAYGKAIGVSNFPSLDNNGEVISLISSEGKLIHTVSYTSDWHPNNLKKEGGWALEMISIDNPCAGKTNWTASVHSNGGTPGTNNSVNGSSIDNDPPKLIRTYNRDSLSVVAVFDEPLDSLSASIVKNYSLDADIEITSATPLTPLFNEVSLQLNKPFEKRKVYTLKVINATDCNGNIIGGFNSAKAGWVEEIEKYDLKINEILFNPKPGGYDFVELYNASNKILDVSKIYISNKSSGATSKQISASRFLIFPGQYIIITENSESLQSEYLVKEPSHIFQIPSMPSYPDDEGAVVITDYQGQIIDEVTYFEDWHFSLISDPEGVSLERIDPMQDAQKSNNWHSASSTSGYATPTYANSQYRNDIIQEGHISIASKIFSPDNDGTDDVATIHYNLEEAGYVANIIIFDSWGRPVRSLIKNALLGIKGSWNWDGLNDKKQSLSIGIYIIYTELFNLQGKKKIQKNTIILARRLS